MSGLELCYTHHTRNANLLSCCCCFANIFIQLYSNNSLTVLLCHLSLIYTCTISRYYWCKLTAEFWKKCSRRSFSWGQSLIPEAQLAFSDVQRDKTQILRSDDGLKRSSGTHRKRGERKGNVEQLTRIRFTSGWTLKSSKSTCVEIMERWEKISKWESLISHDVTAVGLSSTLLLLPFHFLEMKD